MTLLTYNWFYADDIRTYNTSWALQHANDSNEICCYLLGKLLLRMSSEVSTVLAKFCWWILMKWVVLFGTAWISTLNSKPVLLVIPFSWNGRELLVKDSMELDISDPLHSPILATVTSIVSLSSCQPCAFNCPLLQLSSGCNKTKVVRKFLQPMDLWVNPLLHTMVFTNGEILVPWRKRTV